MQKHIRPLVVTALLVSCAAGCAHKSTSGQAEIALSTHQDVINPHLIFAPDEFADFDTDVIELSRNDDQLGNMNAMPETFVEVMEVRNREFLRTINGRPREYSTTSTHTIRRGIRR